MMGSHTVRFDDFEIQLGKGDLKRNGRTVKLPRQPSELLVLLVQNAGSIVSREDIQKTLWPDGTVVDFDQNINFSISRIRDALGDDPGAPRYVETVPRKGYRFLGEVHAVAEVEATRDRNEVQVPPGRTKLSLLAILLAGALLAGAVVTTMRRPPEEPVGPMTHFVIRDSSPRLVPRGLALSPDGSRLVYASEQDGRPQLMLRRMDQPDAEPLPGTEHGSRPFFSPDGEWVAYYDQQEGLLEKVSVRGGTPFVIATNRIPALSGGSWSTDGTIYFSGPSESGWGLWRIPASGGRTEPVNVLDGDGPDYALYSTELLPGGKALLVTQVDSRTLSFDEASVALLSLETGDKRVLLEGGAFPKYVPTGHLLYRKAGTLFAVRFDERRQEVVGAPVPVLEGVGMHSDGFAVSRSGTVSYVPSEFSAFRRRLAWVDRQGDTVPLSIDPAPFDDVHIAPDGRSFAVSVTGPNDGLWLHDLVRGTTSKLTQEGSSTYPIWTPDGERLVFISGKDSQRNLWWRRADGSDEASPLAAPSEYVQVPGSFSPDGRLLAFQVIHPDTGGDLAILPMEGERVPVDFLSTPAWEGAPRFSPDGRWLAYVSNETGRYEVYVRPYPGPGGKRQISTEGGRSPVWSRDGTELFYRKGDALMAVGVTLAPSLRIGASRPLFRGSYWDYGGFVDVVTYDVSADGERFLMVVEDFPSGPAAVHVIVNWAQQLGREVRAEE